jgi:hypothetical protein
MTIEDRLRESLRDPAWESPPTGITLDGIVRRARGRDRMIVGGALVASAAAVAATILAVNAATGGSGGATPLHTPTVTPTPSTPPVVTTPVLGVTKSGRYVIQQPDGSQRPVHADPPTEPAVISAVSGGWIITVNEPAVKCICPTGAARLAEVDVSGRVQPFGPPFIGTVSALAESPDERLVALAYHNGNYTAIKSVSLATGKVAGSWSMDPATENDIASLSWAPDSRQLTFIAGDNTGDGVGGQPITFDTRTTSVQAPRLTVYPRPPRCDYSAAAWSEGILYAVGYCGGGPARVSAVRYFQPRSPERPTAVTIAPRDCLDGGLQVTPGTSMLLLRWCGQVYRVDGGRVQLLPGNFSDAAASANGGYDGTGHAAATVVGSLHIVGGPYPGIDHLIDGTIEAHAGSLHGSVVATTTTTHGRFSLDLPPGTYVLTGNGTGNGLFCTASPSRVRAGLTTHAKVVCPVP